MKWIRMKYIKNNKTAFSCSRSCFFGFESDLPNKFQKLFFDNVELPVQKTGILWVLKLIDGYDWKDNKFVETAKELCNWFIKTMDRHTELEGGYWTISIEERNIENNE